MTMQQLIDLANWKPFEPFTIHMNDGSRLKVAQPDGIVLHRNWPVNALIMLPNGRFSIIYIRNVAHVATRGQWPKFGGRKRRNGSSGSEE